MRATLGTSFLPAATARTLPESGAVPRRSSSFDAAGEDMQLLMQSPQATRGGVTEGWQSGSRPMTRIASKFGIAAALTLGMLSTAAAQGTTGTSGRTTTSTRTVPVGGKETTS